MNICCCAGSVLPHVCVSVPPGSPAPVGVPVFYCSLCESFFRVCFMFITLISTISYLLEICQLQVTIQLFFLLASQPNQTGPSIRHTLLKLKPKTSSHSSTN